MATALIVDTSVLVATLLEDEPEHELSLRLLSHAALREIELTAVAYAKVEIVSAMVRAVRRNRLVPGQLRSPDRILAALPVSWAAVEPILARAMALALAEGFSVYDALPVAQAETSGLHLLTLDVAQRDGRFSQCGPIVVAGAQRRGERVTRLRVSVTPPYLPAKAARCGIPP